MTLIERLEAATDTDLLALAARLESFADAADDARLETYAEDIVQLEDRLDVYARLVNHIAVDVATALRAIAALRAKGVV